MTAAMSPDPQVVICLENAQISARIEALLRQHGVIAVGISPSAVSTGWDLPHCRVVVTYTAMIGCVRALMDLPVVNFETFIFEKSDDAGSARKRQFDAASFLKRVFDIMNTKHRMLAG
ncbi:hypothetical protein FG152_18205 [Ochrobactrum sp. XJ1]|nr:hypothetical protein [Ochrobactrum sp. XJ1]